jgi:hypothetical protein
MATTDCRTLAVAAVYDEGGWHVRTAARLAERSESVDYGAALIEQNRLLADVLLAADPATPVPTCPGWTLLQLLRHVGRGDRWAAQIIRERATG